MKLKAALAALIGFLLIVPSCMAWDSRPAGQLNWYENCTPGQYYCISLPYPPETSLYTDIFSGPALHSAKVGDNPYIDFPVKLENGRLKVCQEIPADFASAMSSCDPDTFMVFTAVVYHSSPKFHGQPAYDGCTHGRLSRVWFAGYRAYQSFCDEGVWSIEFARGIWTYSLRVFGGLSSEHTQSHAMYVQQLQLARRFFSSFRYI